MGKYVLYGIVVVALSSLLNWVNLGRSIVSTGGGYGGGYYGGTGSSSGGGHK